MMELSEQWQEYPLQIHGQKVWRKLVNNVLAEVRATDTPAWEWVVGVIRDNQKRYRGIAISKEDAMGIADTEMAELLR